MNTPDGPRRSPAEGLRPPTPPLAYGRRSTALNDRLVLGLKGTMSEVELSTMRNRLERGKLHKAERGALILGVPCGYLKQPNGDVLFDPDEQVRATVQLIFDQFAALGSFGKVYR